MLLDRCHSAGYNHQIMNGTRKTNLSDLYSDRKHAITITTIEDETESGRRFDVSPFIIGLSVVIVLVIGLCVVAYAGYRVGTDKNRIMAATTIASEVDLQYDLASNNIDLGEYKLAVERLEYVVNTDPDYPGAADMLDETRDLVDSTEIPIPESTKVVIAEQEFLTSSDRLSIIRMSYDKKEWQDVISNIDMLKASSADYNRDEVDGILFVALRNRGMQRIEEGDLELGMADLEHAEQITGLDEVAGQRRRWASLYLSASMFWDINWKIVVDNLYILHQIAPNFRDTDNRLWTARTYYGDVLLKGEKYCLAKEQFAFALNMKQEASLEEKLLESVDNCDKDNARPAGRE